MDNIGAALAAFLVLAPAGAAALLGVALLLERRPSERAVVALTAAVDVALLAAALALAGGVGLARAPLVVDGGAWLALGHVHVDAILHVDALGLGVVVLTAVLAGVIGRFSVRYLHREAGFVRFFLLLHLFAGGMNLIALAGTVELLFIGWEQVGLASTLLIGFFDARATSLRQALATFVAYRAGDVGLLAAALVLHVNGGSTRFADVFPGAWPHAACAVPAPATGVVAAGLLLAALVKSAQLPFTGWLLRAMEGPTPSSAIFYGALAIHAGPLLLLRAAPLLEAVPAFAAAVTACGLATSVYAALAGRARCDAKGATALATACQVGLIFAEIGLGFRMLPVIHIFGHATLRTLQFLRAPSVLHDVRGARSALGALPATGALYERVLGPGVRRWLYRLASAGARDDLLLRVVVMPLVRAATALDRRERAWMDRP